MMKNNKEDGENMEKKLLDYFWHWTKLLVVCTILVMIVRAFFLIPVEVSGNSMAPTLKENDFIITENFSEVHRFDVIVFTSPTGGTLVKRVIGLPGDQIMYEKDQLFVNGEPVDEPFLKDVKKKKNEYVFTTDFHSKDIINRKKIPENQYFVLGDNRRLSKDSRSFGTISSESILGKGKIIYYPLKDMGIIR